VRDDRDLKAGQRAIWALGDYHKFATAALWDCGPLLVEACGISPGQRVLDVAAGAAEAGADVVASDLTPENFDAGRREARAHGVQLEWVEADAEALPFGDDSFDVVTSAFGAIFAPHHRTVADELLRVCRPGGTIGLVALVPTGPVLDLFELLTEYHQLGPTITSGSPLLWGQEDHVRELFADRVDSLSMEQRTFPSMRHVDLELLKGSHPALVALYRDLADQPARAAALDRELAELVPRWQREGQELLLIVARKRSGGLTPPI
jgi:SAM-dependent methyltransferase